MGVTLHAIIECFSPSRPIESRIAKGLTSRAIWWEVGTWELNKHYELSALLSERAADGWPDDSPAHTDPAHEFDDEGRQWCDVKTFVGCVFSLPADAQGYPLKALHAAVQNLTASEVQVRLLWYRA